MCAGYKVSISEGKGNPGAERQESKSEKISRRFKERRAKINQVRGAKLRVQAADSA